MAAITFDDNLAEVDPNSHLGSFILRHIGISLCQASLQRHRAFNRLDDAGEFCQQSVSHQLKNSTVVPFDFWLKSSFRLARRRS